MEDCIAREPKRTLKGKVKKIIHLVARYLECSPTELVAEREKAGYSNVVYKVSHGDTKYLYKEYLANSRDIKELQWQMFFKSPRILYECKTYRIDEYIDHVALSKSLFKDENVLISLAKALACIHSEKRELPSAEMDIFYLDRMVQERESLNSKIKFVRFMQICKKIEKKINQLYSESLFKDDLCLCHNDLQFGNILILPEKEAKIIDFEHVSRNIPTVEIANLFNEASTNYAARGAPLAKKQHFIQSESAKIFVKEYLRQRSNTISVGKFLQEVEKMQSIPHYYWFIWAIQMLLTNKEKSSLDYFSFAMNRLQYLHRENFITKNNFKEMQCIIRNSQ
ncbi:choline/ethanolamine kinase [Nematocida ausubeli]|nr:choline/ethanolamine kinase [Nematocida ausubeli]